MKHREQTFGTDPWTYFNALWLKDAMCLFGVGKWKMKPIPYFPKNLQKWPSIGNFQTKCCNMKFPVNAINTRFAYVFDMVLSWQLLSCTQNSNLTGWTKNDVQRCWLTDILTKRFCCTCWLHQVEIVKCHQRLQVNLQLLTSFLQVRLWDDINVPMGHRTQRTKLTVTWQTQLAVVPEILNWGLYYQTTGRARARSRSFLT